MKHFDIHYSEEYKLYIFILLIGLFFCYFAIPYENQPSFLLYIGTLLLSMTLIYLSEKKSGKRYSFILFWSGMFVLGIPMAFRIPLAIDDDQYKIVFNNVQDYSFLGYFKSSQQEKGYLLLNWIIFKLTNGNFNHFITIITYITFGFWGLSFKLIGKQKGSSMFMALFLWSHFYFFTLSAGLIRIFMALPFAFIGLQYIWKNNWKWFLFWIFLGATIHLSTFIMLLFLFFLWKKEFFYKHWIFFSLLMLIVVNISILLFASFIIPTMGSKYQGYGEIDELSISVSTFTTLPIWIAFFLYMKDLPPVSEEFRKKYVIGMILVSLSIIFSIATSMVHIGRIIFYSYIGLLIIISAIFQIRTRTATEIILKSLLIIYSLVYVMSTTLLNSHQPNIFPYQTYLFDGYSFLRSLY